MKGSSDAGQAPGVAAHAGGLTPAVKPMGGLPLAASITVRRVTATERDGEAGGVPVVAAVAGALSEETFGPRSCW